MVGEDFVVTSYEWETFGTGGVANWLAVDRDSKVFVAVKYGIKIWYIVSFGILKADARCLDDVVLLSYGEL